MRKMTGLLCALALLGGAGGVRAQGMRAATKIAVGTTAPFTLEKNEQQDFAIQLGAGTYFVVLDAKRADEKSSNLIAGVQLLKTNGSIVDNGLLRMNLIHRVGREVAKFRLPKPLAARLRVKNDDAPLEMWLTVVPAAKMTLLPFAFGNGEIKPLGLGATEGKGGTLEAENWAYHAIKLPAGKYDVSLYMKQVDGEKTNLMGSLDQVDAYGALVNGWNIRVNEIDVEARQEKRLILTKPQTVTFRVTNNSGDRPAEYTVGIEKATD